MTTDTKNQNETAEDQTTVVEELSAEELEKIEAEMDEIQKELMKEMRKGSRAVKSVTAKLNRQFNALLDKTTANADAAAAAEIKEWSDSMNAKLGDIPVKAVLTAGLVWKKDPNDKDAPAKTMVVTGADLLPETHKAILAAIREVGPLPEQVKSWSYSQAGTEIKTTGGGGGNGGVKGYYIEGQEGKVQLAKAFDLVATADEKAKLVTLLAKEAASNDPTKNYESFTYKTEIVGKFDGATKASEVDG